MWTVYTREKSLKLSSSCKVDAVWFSMLGREGRKKKKKKERETSPACFKTAPGLQASVNHNNSFPFKRRRSGCASSESDDFRTKTRGSDNDSIDSVWHPTPASSTQHQLTWRKKKILLIINWDVSELSVSGIWAMHWLFKSNASTESTPGSSGLLVRTHARTGYVYMLCRFFTSCGIFTDSFLAQWKATKISKAYCAWRVHTELSDMYTVCSFYDFKVSSSPYFSEKLKSLNS